jgi:Tol biopolymer transport system component
MTPERWQRVKRVFHAALGRAPEERSAFLASTCGGDDDLRKEVESLIASHEKDGSFIDSPAYEEAAQSIANDKAELKAGQIVGSYEILSFIGRGGMGEVYLAQDKRLSRRVALKLLPSSLTKDLSRLRRFEQEARAASALNHPNIITIYGIHETNSTLVIATEFVEGENLRERLDYETLDLYQSLAIAIQIASALAAAHKAGIIHRDIKPENIMIRPDGYVKVLDFGLAKLVDAQSSIGIDEAPTKKVKTGSGMIIGTVGYMSPEQARGQTVDARSDIFNLGAVIYEMATGEKPFVGETASDVLAAILKSEPLPLSQLIPEAPPELSRIVSKALRKDREQRYQVIQDMLLDLKSLKEELEFRIKLDHSVPPRKTSGLSEAASQPQPMPAEKTLAGTGEVKTAISTIAHSLSGGIRRHKVGALLGLTVILVVAITGIHGLREFSNKDRPASATSNANPQVVRTTQLTFSTVLDQFPSLSPDGNSIAYCSDQNGSFEIYVKQLTPGGRDLQLTTDGQQNLEPAWSPDGQHIAYFSKHRGGIWIVPAHGGTPKQLVEFGSRPAWSQDGSMIAFQSSAPLELGGRGQNAMPPSTIWIIPSHGGAAKQITQAGNPPGGHGAPSFSPDGKRIVFDSSDFASNSLWSVSAQERDLKKIAADGFDGVYSPDGKNVIYSANKGLWQDHVSPTGEPLGEPYQLVSGGAAAISNSAITADGKKIAYSMLAISSNLWSILLSPGIREAQDSELFARDTSTRHNLARFSPDGRRIAFNRWRVGTSADIWIADADGKNLTQLTSNPDTDSQPSWFPEGDRIAFLSDRNNDHLMLWSITLATGREEPLRDLGPGVEFAVLSPDGKQVAFNSNKSGTINVWVAPIAGGEPKQLTFDEELMAFPCWSPDGHFLAFETKRGDDAQVFIVPSSGGTPIQLTNDRGQSWPYSWSSDGDKIAFAGLRNGIWNIYSVSRSTREQKQLTHYSKLNAFARYPAWSPLGNQIVYEHAETTGNIWLIELK